MSFPSADAVYRMFPRQWVNKHAYMENNPEGNIRGTQNPPGQQGDFVFTPILNYDGVFKISVKTWPNWFLYMESTNQNVRGCEGDPGRKGYWRVSQVHDMAYTVEIALFKEEEYNIYMQNNSTGNVACMHGWPGDEGRWVLVAHS